MKKILFTLFLLGIFPFLAGCTNTETSNTPSEGAPKVSSTNEASEIFNFSETEYDFGVIKQSGGKVSHDFSFIYHGTEPITITGVPTSCACTSATIDKSTLQPGESGVLTVKFNPNLHAEPDGKFFKTAMFITDPKLPESPEVKIWAEIDLDLGEGAFELSADHHDEDEEEEETEAEAYTSITPAVFASMMEHKDFFLVDVHIPEQEHIPGTDAVLPYDEIEDKLSELPAEKDAKIVLYCRSGPMSRAAAYTLVEHGYTNVYDLNGGINAYNAFLEEQSNSPVETMNISSKSQDLRVATSIEYIDFEAMVVTESNFNELNKTAEGKLPISAKNTGQTSILLVLNNHRKNLGEMNYFSISSLDGITPTSWQELLNGMGGHHITGLLTFPQTPTPSTLTLSGMPVGDVTLSFSPYAS